MTEMKEKKEKEGRKELREGGREGQKEGREKGWPLQREKEFCQETPTATLL
jgi:hypothetical protein